jgi:hypothetical protein
MNSHKNRNWKRKWEIDFPGKRARHTTGFVVNFRELANGSWEVMSDNGVETVAAITAAGETHAHERVRQLLWEAKEVLLWTQKRRADAAPPTRSVDPTAW